MENKVKVSAPLVFVTGKGGVGKSLWAAGLATQLARSGKKVLLVEFGETSFYGFFYGKSFGMDPVAIENNLHLSIWSGATCLRDYIGHLVKIDRLADLFFENKVMKALIRGAPALKELAILGKATSGVRNYGPELDFDHVIFDSYATGHFLALLRAPVGMYEAIKFGPMGDQSKAIVKTMSDPRLTEYHVVSLLEELPVSETIELCDALKSEFNDNIKVVVNKSLRALPTIETSSNVFESSIQRNLSRQNHAWEHLLKHYEPAVEVPYYFESEPQKLVDHMAQHSGDAIHGGPS